MIEIRSQNDELVLRVPTMLHFEELKKYLLKRWPQLNVLDMDTGEIKIVKRQVAITPFPRRRVMVRVHDDDRQAVLDLAAMLNEGRSAV